MTKTPIYRLPEN